MKIFEEIKRNKLIVFFWISFLALPILCNCIYWIPEVSNFFLNILPSTSYDTLYVTGAQLVTTILAISLPVSLLIVNHSASNYSQRITKEYIGNIETWIVFSFITFTMLFNIISLTFHWNKVAALYSLIFLFFSFIFLTFQIFHTLNLISPLSFIKRVSDRILNNIANIPKILEQERKKNEAEIGGDVVSSKLYKSLLLQNETSIQTNIQEPTYQIVNFIKRSAVRREREICSKGLEAIVDVMQLYFHICGEYIITEDRYTEYIFEQLNNLTQMAIANRDSALLIDILTTFSYIGTTVSGIGVIPMRGRSPHLVSLTTHQVAQIAFNAIGVELWDSSAKALRTLVDISKISLEEYDDDALTSDVFDKITDVADAALTKGSWFVPRVAAETLSNLVNISIKNSVQIGVLELKIGKIENLNNNVIEMLNPNISETVLIPYYAPVSRGMFPNNFVRIVISSFDVKNDIDSRSMETRYREVYSKNTIHYIVKHLHRFGLNVAEKELWYLFNDIADSLFEIGLACMNVKLTTFKNHFENELLEIVDSLRAMYFKAKSTIHNRYTIRIDVPDILTILGFETSQHKQFNVSSNIIINLFEMCEFDAKTRGQQDSVEIANRIQMLGIYALQNDQKENAELAIQKLQDFDLKISPAQKLSPRLLIDEQMQRSKEEKSDQERRPSPLPDAEEWFYNNVSEDAFIKFKEFWDALNNQTSNSI